MRACQAEGIVGAAERPQIHIVDFLHAFDLKMARATSSTFKSEGGPPKNVRRRRADAMLDQSTSKPMARPRSGSIQCAAGRVDDQGADDDGDIGESIAKIVNENTA